MEGVTTSVHCGIVFMRDPRNKDVQIATPEARPRTLQIAPADPFIPPVAGDPSMRALLCTGTLH